jgi:hypothetical protein
MRDFFLFPHMKISENKGNKTKKQKKTAATAPSE